MVRVALFDATERRAYERELVRTLDEQEVELDGQAKQAASATATVSQIMDAATNTLLLAMDADFVITYFNRGAQEMLGYSAGEAIGRHAEELQDPEETRLHADALGVSTDITELLPALVRHGVPTDWTMSTGAGERLHTSPRVIEHPWMRPLQPHHDVAAGPADVTYPRRS